MMARHLVHWLAEAHPTSMGMHLYEQAIRHSLLERAGEDWAFALRRVGSLRGPGEADVRVPDILRRRDLPLAARLVGAAVSARRFTHRFDLRLPPAPREVVTVHDLPALTFHDEGRLPRWCVDSAARALEVIAPSEFAAAEIARHSGATRITVIPAGVSETFRHAVPMPPDRLAELGISQPFFVHAAGASVRKNLGGLGAAWRSLTRHGVDHALVLCGPPHRNRTEAFAGLPQVHLLGARPPDDVAALMAASDGVIVPSTYEGYGLPVLEGMAAGVPVLATNAGALPEVGSGIALLVEPTPDGLAAGLRQLMDMHHAERTSRGGAGRSRAGSFTWEAAADRHLDIYRRYA